MTALLAETRPCDFRVIERLETVHDRPGPRGSGAGRIAGIDSWRAILLVIGPLIHAAPLVSGADHHARWLEILVEASQSFRMGAFFCIAGLLMVQIDYRQRPDWLGKRVVQLVLPLISAWLLLLVPTTLVEQWWTGQAADVPGLSYLWFLPDLALATLLFWVLDGPNGRVCLPGRGGMAWLALLAAAVAPFYVVGHKAESGLNGSLGAVVAQFPYYFLFFLGGVLVARHAPAMAMLRSSRFWWIGPAALALYLMWYDLRLSWWLPPHNWESHTVYRSTAYLLKAAASVAMVFTILATALRASGRQGLKRLSAASYTIYLFHYPLIVAASFIFPVQAMPDIVSFALLSLIGLGGGLAAHERLVKRFAVAQILFNGRMPTTIPFWEGRIRPLLHPVAPARLGRGA